ncbi:MAG: uroporphyrinogen-III synthase [Gammaproteobacteria bacterium]|nr:uroporphyrinogen-III synthase [Gammaproteobacteria bacterium]
MQNFNPYEWAGEDETILIDVDSVSELTERIFDDNSALEVSDKPVVVLTRQAKHLGNMEELLETLDFQPVAIETTRFEPVIDEKLIKVCENLDRFTDIIFDSRNAVEIYMPLIDQRGMKIPDAANVLAVSAEVSKQLYKYGIRAMCPNNGNCIEALLRVKQLEDLGGRNILIVRGGKGSNRPAAKMRQRGATVEHANVYSQEMPDDCMASFQKMLSQHSNVAAVFLHNEESAINFMKAIHDDVNNFMATTLVVGSERVCRVARKHGWPFGIRWAESPSNKHMMLTFVGNRFKKSH